MTGPPEIDAILERAYAYRHEVYTRLGCPPATFLVTADEYRVLWTWQAQVWASDPDPILPDIELSLYGMRVVKPLRVPWYGESPCMEHFKRSPLAGAPVPDLQPFESLPDALSHCRTERPNPPQRTITCPCGEVVWEMPGVDGRLLQTIRDHVADAERALASVLGLPPGVLMPHLPGTCSLVGYTPPEDGTLSALISAKEPSPSTVADSERSSFEEWSAQVDALLADCGRPSAAGECS